VSTLPPPLMRTRVLLECPRRRQRAFGPKCARSELPVAAARPSKTARETRGPTLIVIGSRLLQFGVGDDVVLDPQYGARLLQQRFDLAFRGYLPSIVTASRRRDSFGAALAGPKCRRHRTTECRSMSQPGGAPRSGRGGRRFKSCHSDQDLAEIIPSIATDTKKERAH
jgi:hypothetical protein